MPSGLLKKKVREQTEIHSTAMMQLFHRPIHNPIQHLLLADQVKHQNRYECQQIGCKCKIIIRTKLGLEGKLRQRKRIMSGAGQDD